MLKNIINNLFNTDVSILPKAVHVLLLKLSTTSMTEARATPFVSMSVPVSIIRTGVRHFKLHLTTIFVRYLMVYTLFGEIIHFINEKMTSIWRFYHPSPSLKGSSTFPSVSTHRRGYTDTDRCSLPCVDQWFGSIDGHGYIDTGARTRTGVAWPLPNTQYVRPIEGWNMAVTFVFH